MTLLADAQEELEEELGMIITHYPSQGTTHQGDEFWYENADWDRSSPTQFPGIPELILSDSTLERAGFTEETDGAVRTSKNFMEEGDLLEFNGGEYVIISKATEQHQDVHALTILGLRKHNP